MKESLILSASLIADVWHQVAAGEAWPWDDVARHRARDWRRFAAYERRLGRPLTARETDRLTELRPRRVTFGSICAGFKEGEE